MNRLDNIEQFEKIIFSACLKDQNNFFKCKVRGINKEDFHDDKSREFWSILDKSATESGITPLIVVDKFKNKTPEERAERLWKLEKLQKYEFTQDEFEYAIKRVKDASGLRILLGISQHITDSFIEGSDTDSIVSKVMERIFEIKSSDDNIKEYNALEALEKTGEEISKRLKGEVSDGVPSGIKTLDKEIHCFYYGLYTLILGRPGHGKTTIMINTFVNNIKANFKPLFISLEMPAVHLIIKILAIWTKIDINKIFNPKFLSNTEKELLRKALSELAEKEFYIVDAVSMSVVEFGIILQKYIKLGCEIAYLDYFQLLKLPNGDMPNDASDFRNIAKTVRENIRRVNRIDNMALVMGAQAGRSVEQRPIEERGPQMRDLEWSSSLEQDAAVVIGAMNREKYEGEECEYPNQIFLNFPKHRYEDAIRVNLAFLKNIQYITDLASPNRVENAPERWKKEIEKEEKKNKERKNVNEGGENMDTKGNN